MPIEIDRRQFLENAGLVFGGIALVPVLQTLDLSGMRVPVIMAAEQQPKLGEWGMQVVKEETQNVIDRLQVREYYYGGELLIVASTNPLPDSLQIVDHDNEQTIAKSGLPYMQAIGEFQKQERVAKLEARGSTLETKEDGPRTEAIRELVTALISQTLVLPHQTERATGHGDVFLIIKNKGSEIDITGAIGREVPPYVHPGNGLTPSYEVISIYSHLVALRAIYNPADHSLTERFANYKAIGSQKPVGQEETVPAQYDRLAQVNNFGGEAFFRSDSWVPLNGLITVSDATGLTKKVTSQLNYSIEKPNGTASENVLFAEFINQDKERIVVAIGFPHIG